MLVQMLFLILNILFYKFLNESQSEKVVKQLTGHETQLNISQLVVVIDKTIFHLM